MIVLMLGKVLAHDQSSIRNLFTVALVLLSTDVEATMTSPLLFFNTDTNCDSTASAIDYGEQTSVDVFLIGGLTKSKNRILSSTSYTTCETNAVPFISYY